MRIAIAGGGWYGCHIASVLKTQCERLDLYEKNDTLFSEASGNNQFRLHQGLHYPRSSETRHQSRDGYQRFSERYSAFSRSIEDNYYLIPSSESLIDFDTYFSIMFSSGLKIEKTPISKIPFIDATKIEGALRCYEKVILTEKARTFFNSALGDNLLLGVPVYSVQNLGEKVLVNGRPYDYFIDATWGALNTADAGLMYETTILLYYELTGNREFPALTLMDGQLWSIYPTETQRIYTLSSVPFTPIATSDTKQQAYKNIQRTTDTLIREKINLMESQVCEYFPDFRSLFRYQSPQISIKTKPKGKTDNRAASVKRTGRSFTVQSGKIDNIFHAADYILGELLTSTI